MAYLENETTVCAERILEAVGEGGEAVRQAFSRFPSGVAALCAQVDGAPVGIVASSFTVGVSFYPPMVMFAVHENSTTWPVLRTVEYIGISVLGREHAAACRQLASKSGDRFAGLNITTTPTDAVLIGGSPVWLETRIASETPAGDHRIVVLEVTTVNSIDETDPLIYHSSGFRELASNGVVP